MRCIGDFSGVEALYNFAFCLLPFDLIYLLTYLPSYTSTFTLYVFTDIRYRSCTCSKKSKNELFRHNRRL